jgi:hypothetical protein
MPPDSWCGILVLEAGQPDLGDAAPRDLLALGLGPALQLEPEGGVAQHRRPRHQREVLEHEGALGAPAR